MIKKIIAMIKALSMTTWFVKKSFNYVVDKTTKSKIEYFLGLPGAWYRFTVLTYKDNLIFWEK